METEIVETSTFLGFWPLLLILVALSMLLFPVLAIISILKNDFKGNDKLIWILVALLLPFFGSMLYFIIGRPKRIKN
ncbi:MULTISPECIES: PLD nuclease N-terminal domain-containing protein [Hwangdonia]|uniref:PLD nuclease N-terminal domain-containing protein n=1 Tax=Hwangdonia seohaensis TaxID=1240727 RepID=A0ABW3RCK6_9FLAO|nr:PLD nuclease N-terminal domain-containing protein [Hwangdonia seohaensis]